MDMIINQNSERKTFPFDRKHGNTHNCSTKKKKEQKKIIWNETGNNYNNNKV